MDFVECDESKFILDLVIWNKYSNRYNIIILKKHSYHSTFWSSCFIFSWTLPFDWLKHGHTHTQTYTDIHTWNMNQNVKIKFFANNQLNGQQWWTNQELNKLFFLPLSICVCVCEIEKNLSLSKNVMFHSFILYQNFFIFFVCQENFLPPFFFMTRKLFLQQQFLESLSSYHDRNSKDNFPKKKHKILLNA